MVSANRMDDISVTGADNFMDTGENSPPQLLVIVGEPFGEEQKAAIARRIATGLSSYTGNF